MTLYPILVALIKPCCRKRRESPYARSGKGRQSGNICTVHGLPLSTGCIEYRMWGRGNAGLLTLVSAVQGQRMPGGFILVTGQDGVRYALRPNQVAVAHDADECQDETILRIKRRTSRPCALFHRRSTGLVRVSIVGEVGAASIPRRYDQPRPTTFRNVTMRLGFRPDTAV